MRFYTRYVQIVIDEETRRQVIETSKENGASVSLFIRTALLPGGHDELDPSPTIDFSKIPLIYDGRAKDKPLKSKLGFTLTENEYEVMCRAAMKRGMSRAEYVRMRLSVFLEYEQMDSALAFSNKELDQFAANLLKELKDRKSENE
ncbi:hypothetical protein BLEM_2070 [Bifidobacterium lemurum]|uniref:Uncharacterized protein n=1 Tax=Bifidobacterium lemurum TaxID=1603886 RepID=A0A261FLM2_9BIFI|nr:hypothetical protein [Bifidobacterium lemurum]OZG59895.1 hypothetical protein BLEM_2070 [Bifidobacterium lemurum]QOL33921.1 hypothetical protein BL8807_09175 [Bifidobacterium lemurum]